MKKNYVLTIDGYKKNGILQRMLTRIDDVDRWIGYKIREDDFEVGDIWRICKYFITGI